MTTLEKIKNLVFGKSEQFADIPLEDGSILRIDTEMLEVGSKAVIVDADGNEVAPIAGDLILQDGTTVTLDDMGIVTAVNSPAEDPEMDPAAMEDVVIEPDADPATVVEDVANVVSEAAPAVAEAIDAATPEDVTPEDAAVIADEVVALIEEEVAKVQVAMNKSFEEFKKLMVELAEEQVKTNESFEAFKKSPSGKTISQMEFTSEPETPASKLEDRIERIKNLRKNKN